MKTRFLSGIFGAIFSTSLILTVPVFAYDSYDRGGYGGHDYSSGGHVDHDYRTQPYYGYGDDSYTNYGRRSGAFGYWGKDARHHHRGHQHHHNR
jgi:hypothetical protein